MGRCHTRLKMPEVSTLHMFRSIYDRNTLSPRYTRIYCYFSIWLTEPTELIPSVCASRAGTPCCVLKGPEIASSTPKWIATLQSRFGFRPWLRALVMVVVVVVYGSGQNLRPGILLACYTALVRNVVVVAFQGFQTCFDARHSLPRMLRRHIGRL